MSEQITSPQDGSEPDPLNDIHQLLEDTAEDILQASVSTELWPRFAILFLWLLEDRAPNSLEWKNHLITIRDNNKRLDT